MKRMAMRKKSIILVVLAALLSFALAAGIVFYALGGKLFARADEGDILVGVTLEADETKYELNGNYYREKSVLANPYYAFTQGMTAEEVQSRLQVTLHYENEEKGTTSEKVLKWGENAGGEVVSWKTTPSFGSTDSTADNLPVTITYTVTDTDGSTLLAVGESTEFSETLNFYKREIGGFAVKDSWVQPATEFTTTTAPSYDNLGLSGQIATLYNNGLPAPDQNIPSAEFNFTGAYFAPNDAQAFEDIATGGTYTSTVLIPYTGSLGTNLNPLSVTVEGVKFVLPSSIGDEVSGQMGQQRVGTPLDLNFPDLTVKFGYKIGVRNVSIDVPLEALKRFQDENSLTYYEDDYGLTETPDWSTKVRLFSIVYKITLTDGTNSKEYDPITLLVPVQVDPAPVTPPVVSSFLLDYRKDDCTVTVSGVESYMNVVLVEKDTLTYSDNRQKVTGFTEINSAYADITKNITDKTAEINFNRGGMFYLLVQGNNDDYYFTSPTQQVAGNDMYWLLYEIQVDRAPVDLELSGYGASREYGDDESSFTLVGTVKDYGNMGFTYDSTDAASAAKRNDALDNGNIDTLEPDSMDAPSYQLFYYWGTMTKENATTKIPKERGTYKVFARTTTTARYKSGTSNEIEFEIVKRKIDLSKIEKEKTYKGEAYTVGEIVNYSRDDGKRVLAYDDKIDSVVSVSAGGDDILHAKDYTLTVTLKSGAGDNYELINGDNLTFTVKPFDGSFTVTQFTGTFVFGADNDGNGVKDQNVAFDTSGLGFLITKGFVSVSKTTAKYYLKNQDGTQTEVTNDPAPWAAGDYIAEYSVNNEGNGNCFTSDYTCAAVKKEFKITPLSVDRVTLSAGSTAWGSGAPATIYTYSGSAITSTFTNWKSGNASDGNPILTAAVAGVRFDGATKIAEDDITVNAQDGSVLLTEAGSYTVTVTLNANYVWTDGINEPLEFCGKIEKQTLSGLTFDRTEATYNAEAQSVQVRFCVGSDAAGWTPNILAFDSIEGSKYAAASVTVTGLNETGMFDVTYAGNYAVSMKFASVKAGFNYAWADGEATSVIFTVKQRELALNEDWNEWDSTTVHMFDNTTEGLVQPTPQGTLQVVGTDSSDSLTFTTALYKKTASGAFEIIPQNKVTESGTFRIAIVSFGANGDDTTYLNYCLPEPPENFEYALYKEFTIVPRSLDAIVLTDGGINAKIEDNSLTFDYDGKGHSFSQFIEGWNSKYSSGTLHYLDITVDEVGGNLQMKDAATYHVSVKPADSYEWNAAAEADKNKTFEYTVTIEPFKLTVNWLDAKLYDNGGTSENATYSGNEKEIKGVTLNTFGTDEVTLSFTYALKTAGALGENNKPLNAGEYTITAEITGGAQKGNYTLANDLTRDFTVLKQSVQKPVLADNHTATYNAANKTVSNLYKTTNDLYGTLVSTSVAGYRPEKWFTNGRGDEAFANSCATFDPANGTLTYTNAGYYVVTFTLNGENYCWEGDNKDGDFTETSYNYTWTAPVEVERAALYAPMLGDKNGTNYRTMEWKNGVADLNAVVFADKSVNGIGYGVQFGKQSGENDPQPTQSPVGEVDATAKGTYYALLTINSDEKFNYEWDLDPDDTQGADVVSPRARVDYTEGYGTQIYLYYAVTSSILAIQYEVKNNGTYDFGANGQYIGQTQQKQLGTGDLFVMTEEGKKLYDEAVGGGTIVFTYRTTKNSTDYLSGNELVNGLPWDEGTYYVTVVITFKNDADYNQLRISTDADGNDLTVKVNKRAIEVEWVCENGTVTGTAITATYNGENQIPTAYITNMPGAKEPVAKDDLPALTYSGVDNCKNASAYSIAVTNAANNNLTVGTHESVTATFTIEQAALTASGVTVQAHHIYGESFDGYYNITNKTEGYGKYFTVDGLMNVDLEKDIVKFEIRDGEGNKITSNLTPVGGYAIVPVLVNENGNYTLAVSQNGTLTVDRRQITVTINESAATSVYGSDPLDLNDQAYYTVTWAGEGNAIPESVTDNKTVFTFSVEDGDGLAITSLSDCGDYAVLIDKVGEDNYDITFNPANYTITEAEITITAVEGYTGIYDATAHPLFQTLDADTKNDTSVKWYFGTKNEAGEIEWRTEAYDSASDTICNVTDSNIYYVKATAANHKDCIYRTEENGEIGVEVTVDKAKIVISVKIEIFYGENSPLDFDGNGTIYKGTLADLRTENGIYAIDANNTFKSEQDKDDFYDSTKEFVTGSFSYAFKEGFSYEKGNDASETAYVLVFDPRSLVSDNYYYEGAESYLIVKPLPVTMTVEDLTTTYGTTPKTPEVELSTVTTAQTSSYEGIGGTIDIFDKDIAKIVTVTTDAIVNGKTNDVKEGGYEITLTLNGNYTWQGEAVKGTYMIIRAQNAIDEASYHLFEKAGVAWKEEKDRTETPAWIYGGYDPSTNALQNFDMLDRSKELRFSLKRGEVTLATGSANADVNLAATLQGLFSKAYGASGDESFLSGEYTVTFEMDRTVNYEAFEEVWHFEVGKAELIITIDALSVTYGAENPTYTSRASGLTTSTRGGAVDELGDVISFTLSSAYEKGYENGSVGTYLIFETVTDLTKNADGKYEARNYNVTFVGANLTVTPRNLKVTITDLKNFYDLFSYDISAGDYITQTPAAFNAELAEGSDELADGDTLYNVFLFRTDALTGKNGRKTNDAGDYAIYLTQGDRYGNNGSANYTVQVVNGSWEEALPVGALGGGAGTFTIMQAVINADIVRNFATLEYDGQEKVYGVDAHLGDGMNVTFETKYYDNDGNELPSAPKNVGSYRVEFKPTEGDNYITSVPTQYPEITKRVLSVSTPAVTGENGTVIKSENGKILGYYFNGGNFTKSLIFEGVVAGEQIAFEKSVLLALTENQKAGLDTPDFMRSTWSLEGNEGTFTVRNAGVYSVTLTLASNGTFNANNYQIRVGSTDGNSYRFELNILLATLSVSTMNASVQYGAQDLNDNTFTGFTPVWEVYQGDSKLLDDRAKELLSSEDENGYLNRTNYTFGSSYAVGTSKWGGTYNLYLDTGSVTAYNFAVERGDTENKLSLAAREVMVKVLGFGDSDADFNELVSFEYNGQNAEHVNALNGNLGANRAEFLTVTGNGIAGTAPSDYSDPVNGVVFRAEGGVNVGTYRFAPRQEGYPMYAITFVNVGGSEIDTDDLNGAGKENLPRWRVTPAVLTIRIGAYAANVSYQDLQKNAYIDYGFGLEYRILGNLTFAVRYSGWKNGEGNEGGNINAANNNQPVTEFTVVKSDDINVIYRPWDSQAGEVYTVSLALNGFAYTNYTIKIEEAVLTIEQLAIEAETIAATYTEKVKDGAIDYNGGISGIEHDVKLAYTYGDEKITLPVGTASGTAKAPSFSAAYQENGTPLSAAPAMAGNYKATVTLAQDGNYKFANGYTVTLDYEVKKQSIRMSWDSVNKFLGDGVTSATAIAEAFRSSLMTVVVFNRNDDPIASDGYTADDTGLAIVVTQTGRYSLTLEFNGNASRNYDWGDGVTGQFSLSFTVTTSDKEVFLKVTIGNMTYGGTPSDPSYTLTNFNGNEIAGAAIAYTYAPVYANNEYGTFTSAFPQNAGRYVVRAYYAGGTVDEYAAADAYCEFEIYKATVFVPVFTQRDTVYTGNTLTATVEYDTLHVYIVPSGIDYTTTETGATLRRTNANTYSITFALRSDLNHVWDSGIKDMEGVTVVEEDGAITRVTLTWTVKAAEDNEIVWNGEDISVIYGEGYALSAGSKYNGGVTLYIVSKGDYENAEAVPSEAWTEYAAEGWKNAGEYFIKALCEGNSNFNEATAYKSLTIGRATLTVTAYGTLTYEQKFSEGVYGYTISGFVNGDDRTVVTDTGVTYLLVDGTLNKDALDAREYALTMALEDGFVKGLSNANYNIVMASENGVLTVAKREITIVIGDAEGVYNETPDSSAVLLRAGEGWTAPAGVDLKTYLGTQVVINATKESNVGTYTIGATACTNGNYAVTFENGTYTIVQLRVRLEIEAGGGVYGGTIAGARVTHIYTVNASVQTDLGADALTFLYRYTGTANDGTAYNGDQCPTKAGNYIATVTGMVAGENYALDLSAGDVSVHFVIAKAELDPNKIVVEEQEFKNKPLLPVIEGDTYKDFYTVNEITEEFVDVGTHYFTVTLNDFNNYKWKGIDVSAAELRFVITKASNRLVSETAGEEPTIKITDWVFGQFSLDNMPTAHVEFGDRSIIYMYATSEDGEFTTGIPANGDAGDYWVRVTVLETDNYKRFDSAPVKFKILPYALTAPALSVTQTVYTGSDIPSEVLGYDDVRMGISYQDGTIDMNGNAVTVYARNAGEYTVRVSIKNTTNYCWAEGTQTDENGNALMIWTVAKQKVALPTDSDKTLVVNGSLLEYFPNGFLADIMRIEGNQSAYGGEFTATVSLIDTANYEWADGTVGALEFTFSIVGANTVFIVVIGGLSALIVVAGGFAIGQYAVFRRRKAAGESVKEQASAESAQENNGGDEQ